MRRTRQAALRHVPDTVAGVPDGAGRCDERVECDGADVVTDEEGGADGEAGGSGTPVVRILASSQRG